MLTTSDSRLIVSCAHASGVWHNSFIAYLCPVLITSLVTFQIQGPWPLTVSGAFSFFLAFLPVFSLARSTTTSRMWLGKLCPTIHFPPDTSGSLPWAFSKGICRLLLHLKGIQAHWAPEEAGNTICFLQLFMMGNRIQPRILWADEIFLSFNFLAICCHSGVLVVMSCCILFSLVALYTGFCAIQRINDLIFQVQWPLMALMLLSTTENVAAEVCGEFYLQSFFQSKSTNNSSFSSSLASIWPRAASSTWNLRKPHSKRSYLYIHWVAGKGLAKGLLLVHTSAKNKECLEHFPLPLALDY